MKYENVKDIDVWFIIDLANKIYKLKDKKHILWSNIPFLISVCDFGFKRNYLTYEQQDAVAVIAREYKMRKNYLETKNK